MPITLSGLASGLDSKSLVEQLVGAEKQPMAALASKATAADRKVTAVNDIVSKLRTLKVSAEGLDTASEVRTLKTVSSDSTHAGIAVSSAAAIAEHSLRVTTLARSQTVTSRTFTSADAGALGTGSVDITTGAATVNIAWTSADSLATIAQRINDSTAGVSASVVFDGTNYRMVATAKNTGTAAASTFLDAGDGLNWSAPGNITRAATNASFNIDGISMSRAGNVVSDALTGVTLTLTAAHAVTDPDTTFSTKTDDEATTSKLKAFADAYNAALAAIDGQLGAKAKETDKLHGDSTLIQLRRSLTSLVGVQSGKTPLADIGLKRDVKGVMSVDTTKLKSALTANEDAVTTVLVTEGLASGLATLIDTAARTGDGTLVSKSDRLTAQAKAYRADSTRIEAAADKLGARLRRQFTQLELAVGKLNTDGARIQSLLYQ